MTKVSYWLRVSLGLLVSLVVAAGLEFLPQPFATDARLLDTFLIGPGVHMAVVMFLCAAAGAYVAKVNFLGPAVLFAVISWILAVNIVRIILESVGTVNIMSLSVEWSLGLLFGIGGAVLGAVTGRRFSQRRVESASDAA